MHKIVYLTPPAHGHVNPTLPVVQALVQRGEQVIYYNTEEFRPAIERTGATFCAYKAAMASTDFSRLLQEGSLANITTLILHTTERLLPHLLVDLQAESPDLVVFDSIALWGKMAATELNLRGAASISHFIMDEKQATLRDLLQMMGQALPQVPNILAARRRLVKQYGKSYPADGPLFPMRAGLNIVFTARELQPQTPLIDQTFRFVGPSINPQTRGEALPFEIGGGSPVVYISLGTVHSTHTAFYRVCFEAFAESPGQFILSAGKHTDIGALGAIPANFIVRPSVPQLEVLKRADIFITHGGMNSIHEGLYYGVPLIVIPHQYEQLFNARCVAARGAGMILYKRGKNGEVSVAELRHALQSVLADASYGRAAQEVQQVLHATGGYKQAADEILAYLS